ncbi:MAG: hypothetical protein ABIJ92_03175 [Candidatus Aenigmatarchaeota archaeon]
MIKIVNSRYTPIWILTVLVFLAAVSIPILAINSPSGDFTASPNTVYFNWTSGLLNLTANANDTQIAVVNSTETTFIIPNYSQHTRYAPLDYSNLNVVMFDLCFDSTSSERQSMEFNVHNTTVYKNSTEALNASTYEEFYLEPYLECPPGQYQGNFSVRNLTNTSDTANVTGVIDIPIGPDNTYIEANHTAFFRGNFTSGNNYQRYYLWTNQSANITAAVINLSGLATNLDFFLFDNTTASTNSSTSLGTLTESVYQELPLSYQLWEMRIFSNTSTSGYIGNVYFTTLNITNTDYNQITTLINLGTIVPKSSNTTSYGLVNQDETVLNLVNESIDIYKIQTWVNQNQPAKGFSLLVPNFTQKIQVKISWVTTPGQNVTNWNLSLFDNQKALLTNSSTRYLSANKTSATLEEVVEYTGPFTTTNEGYWNISVHNITNSSLMLSVYNLTAKLWVNTSEWVSSTYNQSTTLNYTAGVNGTLNVTLNMSLPTSRIMSGDYQGYVAYQNGSGWQKRAPLDFNVKAGSLLINNSLRNSTVQLRDNVGFNRLGAQSLYINISMNNTGSFPINYSTVSNLSYLQHISNASAYINYTVDSFPTNLIAGGVNDTIDISFQVNTSRTLNAPGIYRGWILFNTTNIENTSTSSYPYETFNLTLEVNLSDKIDVFVYRIMSSNDSLVYGNTIANYTSASFTVAFRLANGTNISQTEGVIGIGNISSITMTENNRSNSVTLGNITVAQGSGIFCPAPTCIINATVPPNVIGGMYSVAITARWNTSRLDSTSTGFNLTGTGINKTLRINNTGIYMTILSGSTITQLEGGATSYVNVSVFNYGHQTATGTLELPTWSYATITAHDDGPGTCSSGSPDDTFTSLLIPGYGAQECTFRFRVVGSADVSADQTTTKTIVYSPASGAFNNVSVSLRVNDDSSGTTTPGSGSGTTGDECDANSDCSAAYYCSSGSCNALSCSANQQIVSHKCVDLDYSLNITDYTSSLRFVSGGTNSTTLTVKSTGSEATTLELTITINDSINYTIDPTECDLIQDDSCTFDIDFTDLGTSGIGDLTGTYKVTVKQSTNVSKSASFTLTILPTAEQESDITQSYEEYIARIAELQQQLAEIEATGLVSEDNLSKVKVLLNQSNDTLNNIKSSIDSGDFVTADSLLKDLESSTNRIVEEIASLESGAGIAQDNYWQDLWFWAAMGVIIVVVIVLLVYMLLPSKQIHGASPKGFKPKGKSGGSFWDKIKGSGKTKQAQPSPTPTIPPVATEKSKPIPPTQPQMQSQGYYNQQGYQKDERSQYRQKTSTGQGLKDLFKKKKKKKDHEVQRELVDFITE